VKRDHGPAGEGAVSFHTTHWTIVMRAVQSQAQGGQSALAELCRLYWYPLYVFARLSGHSPDDAQDLIQGFFLYLLEHRAPTGVDRLKGKFRSFLFASLQNYLSDELDRARCLKRGGNEEFVHLDAEDAEERYRLEPVEFLTAEKIFDARWAMTVLGEAMNQLRQEYATEEKASTFETLKVFLDPINSIASPSYEEAAHQLQVSMDGVKTLIHRLRKQYTALLREEVGRTVCDPAEIDEEIHALCEALVASEGRLGSMKMEDRRTCSVCGTEFSANMEFCPVCVLRRGLDEPPESDESSLEKASVESSPALLEHRFEHYELVKGEDGKPIELGRGAMGVTYKAFDVDLHCPVTLKVISEKYLGEESARLRFFREARAAASIRHPNVASVFHLGRSGQDHFYAMEFVEGETLENLIKRSGRLEVNLALEIVTQTAAGLAAVHKRNLVHRDIKPSNIMVSAEEGSSVTAKIIDLGLAKPAPDAPAAAAISTPGAFAGTPEFASPEQFAGIQVDIRSDLYSLGVTLWEMVTGQAPFQGSPAEVMYQHQHASLPLDRLKRISQPVVVLLEVLLEKDPGRRFQNPAELLKAMPTITGAIDARRRITRKSLQKMPPAASPVVTRKPPSRLGQFVSFILGRANASPSNTQGGSPVRESRSPGSVPKRISIARLPVTGSDVFGREEDIAFLDDAWANQDVNVVSITAWAGVGKSTLVNHWLRRMATDHYRSAELVFGWSFYRQGSSGETSSADEFLDAALTWFGDLDPRLGTAWEKGERLAKLVAHRRTLLVLDGLEPLQNPPGPQEGRVREPSLQALMRELAAFNTGLCVITTRLPVADIADHDGTSARRRELEQLSSDAGAKLLQALGVKGQEAELRSASEEFTGHCLALTLLGSYLTDAYDGDIRCRKEVSTRLAHDVREGVHARKVMESYQTWFGEGPELSALRMLGLFDRPADEKAVGALLKLPAICGLTESLIDLSPSEWRTILARLRRATLLAREDPHNPGRLDVHPLVREYFGEQLRSQRTEAWKECNRRLYNHYRTVAPQLPDSFRQMEPLFLAVICGCNAGLFRAALHEVYIPRIQRGNASFAAKVLGARAVLLSVLSHFFEHGRWGCPAETVVEGQSLTAEDHLFILQQAGLYIVATRGFSAPEVRICYERMESLCHSLNRPLVLFAALEGRWRYSLNTDKLTATMQIAERAYSLAREQKNSALMIRAYRALAVTLYFLGDFETARQHAMRGVQIWRSGGVQSPVEEISTPEVICQCYEAITAWHLGEITSCQATMVEAISLAKELNDMHALSVALFLAAILGHFEHPPTQVERCASDLIELSTRQNFAMWLAGGKVLRGWAQSASGGTAEGLSRIEDGLEEWRASGSMWTVPYFLALKAEALHLADRTSEALEAIKEAEALVERSEERWWCAELHRLRGVFLTALGAEENQIEASFYAALRIAKEQKSVSLEKRAEATYAEYRRQKASGSGGRGFRLPLW
jgi:serine/threonine protein kinase/DNA-directed RNA polymerase specialized sigma24 family protein/predicted ATPase